MNNVLKLALAAIATATGVNAVQNAPVVPATSERAATISNHTINVGQATDNDANVSQTNQRISLQFDGTVEDLAKVLRDQKVNFVIRPSDAKERIIVNFNDAPIRSAMRAIGTAMGGSFIEEGGVFTFQSGRHLGELYMEPRSGSNNDFKYRVFTPDPKQFEELRKLHGDRAQLIKPGEMKEFRMDPKSLAEIQKLQVEGFKLDKDAMKQMQEMQKLQSKMLDPKALAEVRGFKMDPEAVKELQKLRVEGFKMDPKAMKELAEVRRLQIDPKAFNELEALPGFTFSDDIRSGVRVNGTSNMMKVLDSLSKTQREKHQKQGFLRWSDLTAAQQKMLGFSTKGQWTVSVDNNGKKLTIKSDR
jgi:hypothetical protein